MTEPGMTELSPIPVISVVGAGSNSGKTTLLEKIIREAKARGWRVATIKHDVHNFEMDQPGKDTWRFAQAGADIVAISSPQKFAFLENVTIAIRRDAEKWHECHAPMRFVLYLDLVLVKLLSFTFGVWLHVHDF